MNTTAVPDSKREFLRHCLATVAYRGAKAIRNAPAGYASFNPAGEARTPERLLAHIGDLFDWALTIAKGQRAWKDSAPLAWDKETERFFQSLKRLDDYLASSEPLHAAPEKLFQGPIADSLTHVGQLAMLRRMAGSPVRGESFFESEVTIGRVGSDQTPPKWEF